MKTILTLTHLTTIFRNTIFETFFQKLLKIKVKNTISKQKKILHN